jgi:hypothetical protein
MDDAQVRIPSHHPPPSPLPLHRPSTSLAPLKPCTPQVRPDSIYNRDYNAPTEAEKTLGDVSALPAPMQVSPAAADADADAAAAAAAAAAALYKALAA